MEPRVSRQGRGPVRAAPWQPSELERRRVARALLARRRYRYVSPTVRATPAGYLVESPCCSRNVDRAGGTVDIARLERDGGAWRLFRKDDGGAGWALHATDGRLDPLLALLNDDPDRVFWR